MTGDEGKWADATRKAKQMVEKMTLEEKVGCFIPTLVPAGW